MSYILGGPNDTFTPYLYLDDLWARSFLKDFDMMIQRIVFGNIQIVSENGAGLTRFVILYVLVYVCFVSNTSFDYSIKGFVYKI